MSISSPVRKQKHFKLLAKGKQGSSTKYMHPYLKIKTNNIKALDARPNIGYIPPGDTVKITVKR